jgi:uncharacterized membrane protein YdbT with pleckstrin-like domain
LAASLSFPSVVAYPAPYYPGLFSFMGALVAILFIALWLATELSITDRRVVVKTGLIARQVRELHLSRIEGIEVDQSMLGRVLMYGTVMVRGVGTDLDPIEYVHRPESFKRAFFQATRKLGRPGSLLTWTTRRSSAGRLGDCVYARA